MVGRILATAGLILVNSLSFAYWSGNIYEDDFQDASSLLDFYRVTFYDKGGFYTTNDYGYVLTQPIEINPIDRFQTISVDVAPPPPDVGSGDGTVDVTIMDENRNTLRIYTGISGKFEDDISSIGVDSIYVKIEVHKTSGTASCVVFRLQVQKETPFSISQGTIIPQPNPFYPMEGRLRLMFELWEPAKVSILIYDLEGNEVNELIRDADYYGDSQGQMYTVYWDGRSYDGRFVSTGTYLVYFYGESLNGEEIFSTVEKVVVVR